MSDKSRIQNYVIRASQDEIVETIIELKNALQAASSGLQGQYPWYIHGKASQKECRRQALEMVEKATSEFWTKMPNEETIRAEKKKQYLCTGCRAAAWTTENINGEAHDDCQRGGQWKAVPPTILEQLTTTGAQ
jgi:hypothetical protein